MFKHGVHKNGIHLRNWVSQANFEIHPNIFLITHLFSVAAQLHRCNFLWKQNKNALFVYLIFKNKCLPVIMWLLLQCQSVSIVIGSFLYNQADEQDYDNSNSEWLNRSMSDIHFALHWKNESKGKLTTCGNESDQKQLKKTTVAGSTLVHLDLLLVMCWPLIYGSNHSIL